MQNNHKNYVITVLIAFTVGSLGFIGGIKFQQLRQFKVRTAMTDRLMARQDGEFKMGAMGSNQGFGQGGSESRRLMNGQMPKPMSQFGAIGGEVISQDDKSLTVKMPDESTKIILISDTTTFNQAAPAKKTDVVVGSHINVTGTPNSDGSVTAQNIHLDDMDKAGQ